MAAQTPARNVADRRALSVALLTAVTDLATITLAYGAAEIIRRIENPQALVLPIDPIIPATIPCWLFVFFAFGLYARDQVVGPSPSLRRLLSGITAGTVGMIVISYSLGIHLSRLWVLTLLVMSVLFVPGGRMAVLWLTRQLKVGSTRLRR